MLLGDSSEPLNHCFCSHSEFFSNFFRQFYPRAPARSYHARYRPRGNRVRTGDQGGRRQPPPAGIRYLEACEGPQQAGGAGVLGDRQHRRKNRAPGERRCRAAAEKPLGLLLRPGQDHPLIGCSREGERSPSDRPTAGQRPDGRPEGRTIITRRAMLWPPVFPYRSCRPENGFFDKPRRTTARERIGMPSPHPEAQSAAEPPRARRKPGVATMTRAPRQDLAGEIRVPRAARPARTAEGEHPSGRVPAPPW